ncbi:hypothetical protein KP509_14G098000 [Ceratopteris richardii]|nr:hypothetical protein KP509_14G098000 [Ceratopteris richardii]
MASVPAVLTPSIDTATETSEPGSKKGRREKLPSNLGHVSFSCEMSLYKLNFFTSCKSGGSFKSPPSSPVNIHPHDSYNNFGKHQIDEYQTYLLNQKNLGRSYNDFALNSFNSNIAPQAGLVTSNNALHNNHYFPNHSALTKHHYYTTYPPDYQQSICIATPTQQAASVSQPPVCNQHHPTDYGCPFDGVL